jgi:hypothetical protein
MRITLDDPSKRAPKNPSQVNISEDYEVRYWTAALGVPKDRLAEIVGRVGNSLVEVRRELDTN